MNPITTTSSSGPDSAPLAFPHTSGTLQRTPSGLKSFRRPVPELAAELDRHLSEPSPQPTLFYVMDKIARHVAQGGAATTTQRLLAAQREQSSSVAKRVEAALALAWNTGLIEVFPDGSLRQTAAGDWYVKEGRARRLALWKTNPRTDIGEICAIVQIEDGDGPVYEVPLELVAPEVRDRHVPERVGVPEEGEEEAGVQRPQARRRGRPPKALAAWCAGLVAPARAASTSFA